MKLNLFHPRQAVISLAAAFFVTSLVVATAQTSGPKVSTYTFKNGLELVVIPDRRAPVVTHMVWYKVGAADETAGKSGLAHFLEHLMFKGTAKNPAGRFSQVVATIGGQENAFTSSDYTGYYQRVPSDKLKEMMTFEADRMTGLVLTDAVVLPERDVILEEQNQRVANNPRARLGEQVSAALYLNHPYGRPVIGWRTEIEKLTGADALEFYQRFYGPNNAIVVVAGDVEPDQVRAMAEETYGKVAKRHDFPPRHRPQEPPPIAARSLTLADPQVEQPSVNRSYLVPSFANAKQGESEALDVLAHILGHGSNSRLYSDLVVVKGSAVGAGAWYDGSAIDSTAFGVYGVPRQGMTLQELEQQIDGVIGEVVQHGVTAEELERAKTRLIADAIYAADSQAALARWYGTTLTTGGSVKDVQEWPARIKAVTAQAVQEAARTWLDKRRSVTGYLVKEEGGPAAPAPKVEKKDMSRPIAFVALIFAALASLPAQAMTIERIVSRAGIEAWLVRESATPLVAMSYSFHGGSSQDPADKTGLANLASSLLDEGAGELDAKAFHQRMENHAIELSFRVGRDYFTGSLRSLNEHRAEAFDLLHLALTAPRFDGDAVERVRMQIMSGLRRDTTSPNDLASRSWWNAAFPGHPYGRETKGTLETVPRIAAEEMRDYVKRVFARNELKIAIVGDIDAAAAGALIDRAFAKLPAANDLRPVAQVSPQGLGRRIVTKIGVPQAVVNFGGPGLARDDPDFMAGYIVNHILGGGSFSSRLYREVREKRGLAYGVSDSMIWFRRASVVIGGTATRADRTGDALAIIEAEVKRMADSGPTAEEFAKAKSYLKGTYALGLDTSSKIAAQLVQIQTDNLGIDYIQRRDGLIDAVTIEDATRVAKRLYGGGLLVTVAGEPKGVTSTPE